MIKQIDDKTRVKLRYSIYGLQVCFLLQRKKWYGWKTTSWTYPSTHENKGIDRVIQYLLFKEKIRLSNIKTEREIARDILNKPN